MALGGRYASFCGAGEGAPRNLEKASDLSLNARRRGYPLCAKNPWHLAGSPNSPIRNTSQTGKRSLAILICAHGFAFLWWPPNTPSVSSRSATTSQIVSHAKTSAVHNFWQSPLQSLFKILVFMNAPRSMDRNLKNASMISTQQKKPWSNQKKAERFRRTSSRTSSVQVRSPSRSQPSLRTFPRCQYRFRETPWLFQGGPDWPHYARTANLGKS